MDITGEERIAAKRQIVWRALNSPNILRKCIPNCESLEKKSATEMVATVKFKVGPIPATFKGDVTLTNLNPPQSYTIAVDGQGGLAGSAKGTCDVTLTEDGEGTLLTYKVDAQMTGALAKLGSKMVESSSKKVATQFFAKFGKLAAKRAAAKAAKAEKAKGEGQGNGKGKGKGKGKGQGKGRGQGKAEGQSQRKGKGQGRGRGRGKNANKPETAPGGGE